MEAYRVLKSFQWDGWVFAPSGRCRCQCADIPDDPCTQQSGTGCICHDTTCHCFCGIDPKQYGGDIWFVMDGHPRKEQMLASRFASPDPSLPPTDVMLEEAQYRRLLTPYRPLYVKEKRVATPA